MITLSEIYNLNGKNLLPASDDPSLSPFEHRGGHIEFLELLSVPKAVESTSGYGHVFKVRIKGNIYALKVVRLDAREPRQ